MGGHTGGALASGLACKFFLHAYATSSGDVPARLAEALDLANAAIAHETAENPALSGMGCTLIGAAFGPEGIEWVSVGDSPLFLVRKGEIVLLNEDHSLAPEIDKLAAAGKISWAAAHADPRRHFLRSALTGTEIDLIDRSRRPLALQPGDVVILASDGIHTISHGEIAKVVASAAAACGRGRRACSLRSRPWAMPIRTTPRWSWCGCRTLERSGLGPVALASSRNVISAKHSQPSKPILAPNLSAMRCMRRLRAWQVRCNCVDAAFAGDAQGLRHQRGPDAPPLPRFLHRQCDLGLAVRAGEKLAQFGRAAHMQPDEKARDHARGDAGVGAVRRPKGAAGRTLHAQQMPLEVVELPGRHPANASRRRHIACSLERLNASSTRLELDHRCFSSALRPPLFGWVGQRLLRSGGSKPAGVNARTAGA